MNEIPSLTLNFVEKHPEKAAGILQQLSVEETVAFLEKIPPETGSKILNSFSPQYAGQCFLILNPKLSPTLIQGMKSASTLSMLRIIPSSTLNSFLQLMAPDKQALLKKRLSFPQNSVGAWMDSETLSVPETFLVGDVRRSLRASRKAAEHAPCVVQSDGTVAGLLSLSQLASAKEGSKVTKIMKKDFRSLSDRDSLQTAGALDDWKRFDALPVVNRKGKLVGMLTHKNLAQGLTLASSGTSPNSADSLLADCVNAYTSTLSWLVQAALSSPADLRPHQKSEELL